MISTRAERRAMERAKEKHVRDMMSKGYDGWRDITDEPQTKVAMRNNNMYPKVVYQNCSFTVQVYANRNAWGADKVMIRWNDARPDIPWAMLQKIKSDLFGPERVALEVFPAESNKVDLANLYWLWLLPEGFDCPIEKKRGQL